jgi:hypothetical protein
MSPITVIDLHDVNLICKLLVKEKKSLLQTNYFDDEKLEVCNVPIVVRKLSVSYFSFHSFPAFSKQVDNNL